MLIVGIESAWESRVELAAAACENLEHSGTFQDISAHFSGFQGISQDFRTPGTVSCSRGRVKNLSAPRERAYQKVLYADARFCQVAGFPVRW